MDGDHSRQSQALAAADEAVRLLLQAARPRTIILFGSTARGENTTGSDLDLLVVLDAVPDRFAEMVRLRRVLSPLRMPIDVLVYSVEDVEQRRHWPGTALHEALLEGKILHAAE